MKTCTKCGVEKPLSEFYKKLAGRDGRYSRCKSCHNAQVAARVKADPEKEKARHAAYRACNRDKEKAYRARYRSEHVGEIKAANAAYRIANHGEIKIRHATWRATNTEKLRAAWAAYHARKLQATPAWNSELDDLVFAEAFAIAKAREKVAGAKWHVDHIVPLRSKVVCGLHTGRNIQVIPAAENRSKSNRHWPDMP